jgi:3-hydroxyacyl-[acyl-carrier-protein] dehydratase
MKTMDVRDIMSYLPHRYPFLLIDRVLDYEPGKFLTAVKNVSVNEPMFTGHFPIAPILPGVLITEAMAQAAGVLAFKTCDRTPDDNSLYYFAGIDKARFKKPVVPGDQLVLHVELTMQKRNLWKFNATAKVDDAIVATAEIMSAESGI